MTSPSPFGPVRLIADPGAGRGGVGRGLPALLTRLRDAGLTVDVVEVGRPAPAAAAARAALDEGIGYLVAAGDDRTLHEVVNGMVDLGDDGGLRPVAPDAVLGVVSSGTDGDFVRTFGLDRSVEVIARHLTGDATMPVDLGVVEYVDTRGRPARRVFANLAEVGYGADLIRRSAGAPRLLGRLGRLLSAYAAIARLDRQETAVAVAHTTVTVPVVDLVVANGQFYAGGSKVAPRALPDDGRYNVLVFTGQRSQVFTLTSKIYRGEHLPSPDIVEFQSATVALAPPNPLPVAADGQALGVTPARFWLLDTAVRLKI